MIDSIRHNIEGLRLGSARNNLSLLFNRLCPKIDGQGEHSQKDKTLLALTGGYTASGYLDLYKNAFKQWRQTMEQMPDAVCFEMKVSSPMVVGKGDQNIHEFGITLQLPWGTPVIPGAAIKGVLSSFAHERGGEEWNKGALAARDNEICAFSGQLALIMFGGAATGGSEFAGCLNFYDAWWVPTKDKRPFAEDIINVHNNSYYRDGKQWPDGTDSPLPNKFAVVKPGEIFFFAVKGVKNWRNLAREMITQAAKAYGFGAKTRVGYGRLVYIKSNKELILEISAYDNTKLAGLFNKNRGTQQLYDAFEAEAKKRPYARELDKFFRRFNPYLCFLHELESRTPETWKEIKQIHNNFKKALKDRDIDSTSQVVQAIFRYCQPYIPDENDMPEWLQALAPSAADMLNGKTDDEIATLLEDEQLSWIPREDWQEAIKQSSLNQESREVLLELYFDED